MAFRFKDKERPRGYTSKVAGLLHVRPIYVCKGCFQGDALWQHACVAAYHRGAWIFAETRPEKRLYAAQGARLKYIPRFTFFIPVLI